MGSAMGVRLIQGQRPRVGLGQIEGQGTDNSISGWSLAGLKTYVPINAWDTELPSYW